MYRMDQRVGAPPLLATGGTAHELPSEYFREHVYTTFQDDWVAFQ